MRLPSFFLMIPFVVFAFPTLPAPHGYVRCGLTGSEEVPALTAESPSSVSTGDAAIAEQSARAMEALLALLPELREAED